MIKTKAKNLILPLISLIVFISIWSIFAYGKNIEVILPKPISVFKSLFAIIGLKEFYIAIIGTLSRSLLSFIIAFVLALLLAILSGLIKPINKLLSPIVVILRSTPTMSIILLTLVFMTSKTSPILIGFLIVFPLMYGSFYNAIISVDKELLEMSRVYKVSDKDKILHLYIPSMLPTVLSTSKSNISLNVKIVIAAEVLAQTKNSMGFMMQQAKIFIDTPNLLAWTVVAIVLSYLLEFAVRAIAMITIKRGDI